MRRGRHYATFTIRTLGEAFLGVVGAGFDPTAGARAWQFAQGWAMSTWSGNLRHAGGASRWEGRPQDATKLKEGDVVVRLPLCPLPSALRWLMLSVRCRACCSTSTRPP